MKNKKEIDAYCVITRRSKLVKIDLMGTSENPYYCIHPKIKAGKSYAEGNCNGYEEVVPCKIVIEKLPPLHKCNCKFCDKK